MPASRVPQFDLIIRKALEEDRVRHDVTTQRLIGPLEVSSARIVVKEKAVVCGLAVVRQVFQELDKNVRCIFLCPEGREAGKNVTVLTVQGKTRALLAGERTALNFLGYLSGIATGTRRYVRAVLPHKVAILDTRKTTPTLRELEKYAVRCGGAENHRSDLEDMILVKDNHRRACRRMSVAQMVKRLRKGTAKVIEFEADTLAQFEQALAAGVDIILLDNMSCVQMKKAVILRNKSGKWRRPLLEASGGITLKNIEQVARTGVDRISVGALTHSRRSIDVSMEFIEE